MEKVNKSKFKKQAQIYHLKTIFNNVTNESQLLISKITELQKIFKTTKKLINENIKSAQKSTDENTIKHEICVKLNNLIKSYKTGKTITSIKEKKLEIQQSIEDNTIDLEKKSKKLKYKKYLKEKDLLTQMIKEKKNIHKILETQLKYEKDFNSIFKPRNYTFFDNLYNIENDYLKVNLKKERKKKLNFLLHATRVHLKDVGTVSVNELKKEKLDYIKKFNEYINDKGLNCTFENRRKNLKYSIQIELITDYAYSSDSDLDEEEGTQNLNKRNTDCTQKNIIMKVNTGNTLSALNNQINYKKNCTLSSSEKETNDQEKDTKSSNTNLVNKLVEIKEKYNQLINERYDLDFKKSLLEKKLQMAQNKKETITSSTLAIKGKDKRGGRRMSKFFEKYAQV